MAGQLTISTLKSDTGVLATQNGMAGIAKAWVNWNGQTTVVIRSSFNVSSIIRNSTGNYTVNLSTAMLDSNYSVVTAYNFAEVNTGGYNSSLQTFIGTKTSSSITVRAWNGTGGGSTDTTDLNVAIFGA